MHAQNVDGNFLVLCFAQMHLFSIFPSSNGTGFQLGLISGLVDGIRKSQVPMPNVAFLSFKEIFNYYFHLFLLCFQNVIWWSQQKMSCQLLFLIVQTEFFHGHSQQLKNNCVLISCLHTKISFEIANNSNSCIVGYIWLTVQYMNIYIRSKL